jgi:class 3 adenylate cyclase
MDAPEMGYAVAADGAYIGYQFVGEGPLDLVWQPDWPGNIDMEWEFPAHRALLIALASFARLILHDHRGIGLSSRNVPVPNLETRVADILLVLDAVGSERPVLVGVGASGACNALLAATQPERIAGLAWLDPSPRTAWATDYPWGRTPDQLDAEIEDLRSWGTSAYGRAFSEEQASLGNPVPEADAAVFAKATRNACTPDVAIELSKMWAETDARAVLPTIQTPTLFVCQPEVGEQDLARDTAALVPNAELIEVTGTAWAPSTMEAVAEEIRRFVRVERPRTELDTVLATVLFTDIVGSTETQSRLGDRAWKPLIESHHAVVRAALERWRGVEQDTAGDGFYATFDGPARAIRCADEIVRSVRRDLAIEVRAGLHTGECEVIDEKIAGIAASIGARVAALAGPSEILVSQTVKDLVAGSRLAFEDAGSHELKGVAGRWPLYRVGAI